MMNEILEKYKPKKEITLYPSKLAGISFPVSKPKSRFYERDNGRDKIALAGGEWQNPKTGKLEEIGLPFGIIPCHIEMFITQEYHRNIGNKVKNPRIIQFPMTIPEFLNKLGYSKGGKTYKAIYQQTLKLFNSKIIICRKERNYILKKQDMVANQVALWWDPKNPDQASLFNSMVEISKMHARIVERARPLDLDIVRKIGQNRLEFDIYSWLTSRHYELTKPYTISWQAFHQQCGANYKDLRIFKFYLKKAFANVLELYKHNSKLTEKGILLQNSKTSIVPKKQSEQKRLHKIQEGAKRRHKEGQEWFKKQPENSFKKLF